MHFFQLSSSLPIPLQMYLYIHRFVFFFADLNLTNKQQKETGRDFTFKWIWHRKWNTNNWKWFRCSQRSFLYCWWVLFRRRRWHQMPNQLHRQPLASFSFAMQTFRHGAKKFVTTALPWAIQREWSHCITSQPWFWTFSSAKNPFLTVNYRKNVIIIEIFYIQSHFRNS